MTKKSTAKSQATQEPSLEKFTQRDRNGTLLTPSLQIALYAKKPLPDLAEGAIACYRVFLERFGKQLKIYLAGTMRKVRGFSAKYVDIFPTLCRESAPGLPLYRVFNGTELQDFNPPVFATGAYRDFSWLQVHLQPSLADDWNDLLTLLTAMAQPFPFRYGTVGLSLCWNDMSVDRHNEVPPLIGPLLKRYPGFNLGTPRELTDQSMPPVNWVTLLGPELLERAGGIAKVRRALSNDKAILVMPLSGGTLIRAGDSPKLGDRNRRDNLPLYRRVGSLLRQYRGDQEIELDGLTLEESEKWLARFDS